MNVQKIQSTNNFCPSFGATFVKDSQGYLRRVWNSAEKNDFLRMQIREFTDKLPNHKLEIVNYNQLTIKPACYAYDIFNHNTGKTEKVCIGRDITNEGALSYILYELLVHIDIFKYDSISELYNKLIGEGK